MTASHDAPPGPRPTHCDACGYPLMYQRLPGGSTLVLHDRKGWATTHCPVAGWVPLAAHRG